MGSQLRRGVFAWVVALSQVVGIGLAHGPDAGELVSSQTPGKSSEQEGQSLAEWFAEVGNRPLAASMALEGQPAHQPGGSLARETNTYGFLTPWHDDERARHTDAEGRLQTKPGLRAGALASLDTHDTQLDGQFNARQEDGEGIEDTWFLEWSGEMSLQTFGGPSAVELIEENSNLKRFVWSRRFAEDSFLRVGRYAPRELPGVGQLDGVQGEVTLGETLSVGALAGFRPETEDREVAVEDPLGVAYLSTTVGECESLQYCGTVGLLGARRAGELDRVAILLDQRLEVGPKLRLQSLSEVDVDVPARGTEDDLRLTKMELQTISPVTSFLTLKAGFGRELQLERVAASGNEPSADPSVVEKESQRYWVGARQSIPGNVELDGQVSLLSHSNEPGHVPSWKGSVTRRGLPLSSSAWVTATFYGGSLSTLEGLRGTVQAKIPLAEDSWSVDPIVGVWFPDTEVSLDGLRFTDVGVRLAYASDSSLRFHAGFSYPLEDLPDRTLLDVGVEFWW